MTGAVSLTSGVAFHVSSYHSAATGRTARAQRSRAMDVCATLRSGGIRRLGVSEGWQR